MPDPAETDEVLLGRYARGDAAAFAALYRRHETRIWRYLERNVGNRATAEELMQEVWFAVAREAGRYRPTARFTTWLFTIARNRMIDAVRVGRRQVSLDALGYDAPPVIQQLSTAPRGQPAGGDDTDRGGGCTGARDEPAAGGAARYVPAAHRG